MKINRKTLALMTALAAGSALGAGTTAGTIINNTASATFTDPTTGAPVATPVLSNTVSTTVLPVPGLDIIYSGQASATNNDGTGPGTADANFKKTNILPGAKVDTPYVVLNNGNVDNYVVTLNNAAVNNPSGVVVQYFLASDVGFLTPITTVTVPASGQVAIVQRVTVPANAPVGTLISVSPYGTAVAGSNSGNAYPAVDELANVNVPATPAANKDLQFTDITVFTPTLVNFPTVPTNPANPTTPSVPGPSTGAPAGTVVTPPIANPADPANPVSPPGTPALASDPSAPGYLDPTNNTPSAANPGTPIAVSGNSQVAFPPADTNALPDKVTFNNVVATPVVAGTPADTVSLFPTDATGAPISVYDTATNSFPITTPNGPASVQFTDTAGNLLPTALNPADGKRYPILNTPAGGGSVPYRTVITYPDSNSVLNPVPVVVLVGADSGNDSDITANGTTTDTINPPAAAFGDVPASGTVPNPALIGPGGAAQAVVPGAAAEAGAPNTATATDSTAVFPMLITNLGEYNDTYTLSGTVPVLLNDGTTVNVPVRYVDAAGNPLPVTAPGSNVYVTPLVLANGNVTVFAVIDIPANAAATNGTPLVVTQNATGNFSTIPMTDVNDQITIGFIGAAVPTKTVTPAAAKPGDDLTYTIIGKNGYNTPLKNYVLKEADGVGTNVFANSVFKSVNVAVTGAAGTVLYRFNGGAWQTSNVPVIALTAVTSVEVGLDTAAPNTVIDSADTLPNGGTLTETLITTVK